MPDQELKIIRIISSVPLDLQKGQDIAKRFAERYDIPRFEVKLETDPSLIGGLVIYAGGFRYDYSIRGQLNRIASRLKTQQSIESDISLDASTINHLIRDNLDEALADFSEQPMAPDGEDLFLSADTIEKDQQAGSTQRVIDRMREKLDSFDADSTIDEIGEVLRYSDGVATVSGLQNCRNNELIAFTSNVYGIAMNLEEHQVGVVMLQQNDAIREGMICKRTGSTVQVPTGQALLGRVVDPLGKPIDGLGPIQT